MRKWIYRKLRKGKERGGVHDREKLLMEHIGRQIRMYRKKRGMTVAEVAERIYKSKATVSKYEKGQLAVCMTTLFSIADVLGVTVEDLIDFAPPLDEERGKSWQERDFYMYNHSTNDRSIITSILRVRSDKTEGGAVSEARCFYNITSQEQLENCEHIYRGTVEFSELVTVFSLQNCLWNPEKLQILLSTPIRAEQAYLGIYLAMSATTLLPTSGKVIVTNRPIAETESLREDLKFSREELSRMKKQSVFFWKRDV